MNGNLKQRVAAIIDGASAPDSEKLTLLLGMTLDVHEVVHGHEKRISALEVYPITISRVAKLLVGLGALGGALVTVLKLFGG